MVTSGRTVDARTSSKLAPNHDRDVLIEIALMQILDQCGQPLVEQRRLLSLIQCNCFRSQSQAPECTSVTQRTGFDQPPRDDKLFCQFWSGVETWHQ